MTLLERLQQLADALPPGASVTLPREWLLEELGAGQAADPGVVAVDYTVADLAQLFGKQPSTARSWLEAGLFPGAYKLRGRSWRVPRAAMLAFQQRERARPVQEGQPAPDGSAGSLSDWRGVRRGAPA
jgi:hypothetical protein